jgi:hypothetical protein
MASPTRPYLVANATDSEGLDPMNILANRGLSEAPRLVPLEKNVALDGQELDPAHVISDGDVSQLDLWRGAVPQASTTRLLPRRLAS